METRKVGIMLSELSSGSLPVLFRAAGLDFFILDCEHGGFDYGAVSRIVLMLSPRMEKDLPCVSIQFSFICRRRCPSLPNGSIL